MACESGPFFIFRQNAAKKRNFLPCNFPALFI